MTSLPPRIAAGGPEHVDGVMGVMARAFDPRHGEAWTRSQLAAVLGGPGAWMRVLEHDAPDLEGVCGFAVARAVADEAELLLIGVERPGLGHGTRLMRAILDDARARGAGRLFLEMRDGNAAERMYRREGFVPVGRRPGYYRGPNGQQYDALTLARSTGQ